MKKPSGMICIFLMISVLITISANSSLSINESRLLLHYGVEAFSSLLFHFIIKSRNPHGNYKINSECVYKYDNVICTAGIYHLPIP